MIKNERRDNAARRNRALRKIRKSSLPVEIKLTLETLIDFLGVRTSYSLAWPSAATLAKRLGKSRRTVLWHFCIIKQLGCFHVHTLTPREAKAYARDHYGVSLRLRDCRKHAPNLFEVNAEHALWDNSYSLPAAIEQEWVRIAVEIKQKRNAKTTSRLSPDPTE